MVTLSFTTSFQCGCQTNKFHQNKAEMINQIIINKFLVFAHISLTCWEDTICLILLVLMFASGLNADNSKNGQVITIHVMSPVRCKVHRPINNSQKGDFLDLKEIYTEIKKKRSINTFWEDKNIVIFSWKKTLRECNASIPFLS